MLAGSVKIRNFAKRSGKGVKALVKVKTCKSTFVLSTYEERVSTSQRTRMHTKAASQREWRGD